MRRWTVVEKNAESEAAAEHNDGSGGEGDSDTAEPEIDEAEAARRVLVMEKKRAVRESLFISATDLSASSDIIRLKRAKQTARMCHGWQERAKER